MSDEEEPSVLEGQSCRKGKPLLSVIKLGPDPSETLFCLSLGVEASPPCEVPHGRRAEEVDPGDPGADSEDVGVRIRVESLAREQHLGQRTGDGGSDAEEKAGEGGIKDRPACNRHGREYEVDKEVVDAQGVEETAQVVLRAEEGDAVEDFAPVGIDRSGGRPELAVEEEHESRHHHPRQAEEWRHPQRGLEHDLVLQPQNKG